jgi:hypothetical protein
MAWLVSCNGRSFLLDPIVTRDELVDDLNAAAGSNTVVAVPLDTGEELAFYPNRLDYVLYTAGPAVPRGTSMLTGQQPASMLTNQPSSNPS